MRGKIRPTGNHPFVRRKEWGGHSPQEEGTLMKTLKVFLIVVLVGFTLVAADYSQAAQDRYIVALRSQTANPGTIASQIAREHGVRVGAVYSHSLRGFVFSGPPQAAEAIARRNEVAYVEPDQLFHAVDLPTGIDRADVETKIAIDRIGGDLLDTTVRVAVLDTGVDRDHPDLNISGGIHFYTQFLFFVVSDGQYDDGNGHGTHVSGAIGAKDNGVDLNYNGRAYEVVGVAPGVPIYAVKVLDDNGSGYTSAIIAGIEHVAENADTIQVANMSLGGSFSQALNDAVAGAVEAGVVFVVAAGNDSQDASQHSPASEPTAITVSALADSDGIPGGTGAATSYGVDDSLASFSNYGQLVDICAPGVSILSTLPGGYGFGSGTSMASPHVAGAAALYIANASDPYGGYNRFTDGLAAVQVVRDALVNAGWHAGEYPGYFTGDRDSFPEALLNVGRLELNGTEPNTPPVANAGGSYSGTEGGIVTFDASGSSDADGDPMTYNWDFGDGTTGQGQIIQHAYLWGVAFPVTLTVSDGRGGSDTATTTAIIAEVNNVPVANAGGPYSGVAGTAITFNGTGSSDYDNADGTTANDQTLSYAWDFGDGSTGSGPTPTHSYAQSGTFTATLTVGDGTAFSDPSTSTVTISAQSAIALSAAIRVVKSRKYVDLKWSGATGRNVQIYRNDTLLVTTKNDGAYTDVITAAGTYRYRIVAGSASSNVAEVTF
jgi:subtilisin family serine protease